MCLLVRGLHMWKLKSKVVPEIIIIYCDKLKLFYLICLLPLSLTYLPSVHPSVLFLPSSEPSLQQSKKSCPDFILPNTSSSSSGRIWHIPKPAEKQDLILSDTSHLVLVYFIIYCSTIRKNVNESPSKHSCFWGSLGCWAPVSIPNDLNLCYKSAKLQPDQWAVLSPTNHAQWYFFTLKRGVRFQHNKTWRWLKWNLVSNRMFLLFNSIITIR